MAPSAPVVAATNGANPAVVKKKAAVGPPKVQQSMSAAISRRVEPVATSKLQRLARAWPALVLIVACVVGLTTTRWHSRAPPATTLSSSSSRSTSSSASSSSRAASSGHSGPAVVAPNEPGVHSGPMAWESSRSIEEQLPNMASAALAQEEEDLSLYPPQAWNHTSLIHLPSALVPESWTVATDAGDLDVKRVFADPLLLTMDKFLSPEECLELIALAHKVGFERSMTTRGVTSTRTSTSSYIDTSGAEVLARMLARASVITGEPVQNFEVGPVILYEPGQFFTEHWDSTRDETFGRRLTFFVPLGSAPDEDGGHTGFPLLNFRFPPRNGSAVIFRNFMPKAIYDDYDRRMKHEGEAPKRGRKFAINIWIYKEKYVHWTLRPPPPGVTLSNRPSYNAAAAKLAPELQLALLASGSVKMLTAKTEDIHYGAQKGTHGFLIGSSDSHGVLRVDSMHPEHLLLRVADFLSLSERQDLLREGAKAGWVASETVAGFTSARTSSTAWLYDTTIQQVVAARVAGLVGVPASWVEANALTRYQQGEYYLPHWDSKNDTAPERRISVHITLSVEFDETMGHARFPALNMTFAPRAGVALLWRNYKPGQTEHDSAMLHGFDAPQKGEIYTLTCFVFPRPVVSEETATTIAAPASTTTTTTAASNAASAKKEAGKASTAKMMTPTSTKTPSKPAVAAEKASNAATAGVTKSTQQPVDYRVKPEPVRVLSEEEKVMLRQPLY